MDFSQNGYWHVATMDAKALLSKKGRRVLFAPGVNGKIFLLLSLFAHGLLWGSGAVRRPLMRTGHGRA